MTAVSPKPLPPVPSHAVLEQAAEWFALLLSGDATDDDRHSWEAWLAKSAEHRQAWSYVDRMSRRFEPIKTSSGPRIAASAYQQASNTLVHRRQMLLGIATLAGGSLLGWMTWRYTPLPGMAQAWMADDRALTGEVREVTLADGTHVWLNAASAFNRDYREDRRSLRLVSGEILIDTAVDPRRRPFYVETPQGRLQALGTRFTVRLDNDIQTYLAVYDGAVEVRTQADAGTVIPAGQQVRFTANSLSARGPADPAREAWTRGILIARNIPLSEVVQELRRHYHGYLSLAPKLAELRVFGSYPIRDPEEALTMLELVMPIRVRRKLPWWVSIEPKSEAAGG